MATYRNLCPPDQPVASRRRRPGDHVGNREAEREQLIILRLRGCTSSGHILASEAAARLRVIVQPHCHERQVGHAPLRWDQPSKRSVAGAIRGLVTTSRLEASF